MIQNLASPIPWLSALAIALTPGQAFACGCECAASAGALLPFLVVAAGIGFVGRGIGGLRQRAMKRKLREVSRHE